MRRVYGSLTPPNRILLASNVFHYNIRFKVQGISHKQGHHVHRSGEVEIRTEPDNWTIKPLIKQANGQKNGHRTD